MIDLRTMTGKTTELIWTDGSVVNVNEPNVKMVAKASEIDADDFKQIVPVLVTLLNNNTSNKKFKNSDMEDLTMDQLSAVSKALFNSIEEAENDPK